MEKGEVISVEIRADKFDDWKILDPVPNWIEQIKEKLFEATRNQVNNFPMIVVYVKNGGL